MASSASGHLLNMTEVRAAVDREYQLEVLVQIDLSKEFETAEAYLAFSETDPSAAQLIHSEIWDVLANSIDVRVDEERVLLGVDSVTPPLDVTIDDFKNPFVWPKSEVVLSGTVPRDGESLQITFQTDMGFEEPIALSMTSSITGKSKSRWLVAGQSSPYFNYNREGSPNVIPDSDRADRFGAFIHYLYLGVKHILPGGMDHLLFVLGIFLAARTFRPLLLQISVFTIAHTITLGLATYRIIEPPSQLVEIMIALSILWLGLENMFRWKPSKTRLWVIGGFGLVHGMGFAGALSGLELPPSEFLIGLLGFNVGVEIGQLCFIVLLALSIGWFRKRSWYSKRIVLPISLGISIVALFWAIQRF